ncbi:hypothetical protein LK12_17930 [Novosphingobium malaysiense]|uniref:FAD-dependent oxidoreductase 2 FAD-binding domain-containing protein n=1 Tax=Novosphingobium malaysiense TaxID=1348853 RepID=A0A0B1ZG25_9SPHN|nr:hypothetical protein LK12_17930 [Novosphingobium malaysiense]
MLIDASTIPGWDRTADVIVAGFGMAGACAAIEASESGASVLIVEAAAGSGGTSAIATGHFYLGGGTPVQKACGFEDSPEDMAAYLMAASVDPEPERIALYAKSSVDHFAWLERQGIPFERSYFPSKAVAQPGTECLIWTGNEKVAPFRDVAHPAPRGHKVAVSDPETGGGRAMQVLTRRTEDLGVEALYGHRVTALVLEDGRVVGVRCLAAGQVTYLRAMGGVVLTTGGFGQNERLLSKHLPDLMSEHVVRIADANDLGQGIELGIAAGAATRHMDGAFISTYWYPPEKLINGIIVNSKGERFVPEDSYHARTAGQILAQPDRRAWLIVDSESFDWPLYGKSLGIDLVDGWEDVASMERDLGMPEGALQKTIADYSAAAAEGKDPLGKNPEWLRPFDDGPYAAFDLSFGSASYRAFTLGGLVVTLEGEVLREDGTTIEGLYAAGSCATNLAQEGLSYASGLCLGTASFFGRKTGASVACRAVTARSEN